MQAAAADGLQVSAALAAAEMQEPPVFQGLLIAAAAAAPVIAATEPMVGLGLLLFVTPTLFQTQQAQLAHRH